MRYAMLIDMRRCIGCASCVVACKTHNNLPYGVNWSRMEYEEVGTFPETRIERTPMLCMHCDNPPCVPVCPTGATFKDGEGIVRVDKGKCIGDGACVAECPYGARTLLESAPESYFPGMERNAQEKIQMEEFKKDKVSKCEFCFERLQEGKAPACVQTCAAGARVFGDLDDPNSDLSRLIMTRGGEQLWAELGTKPKVYYLPD